MGKCVFYNNMVNRLELEEEGEETSNLIKSHREEQQSLVERMEDEITDTGYPPYQTLVYS